MTGARRCGAEVAGRMGAFRLPYDANSYIFLDFWGPVSNFGIPIAAVMDTQKSPDLYLSLIHI